MRVNQAQLKRIKRNARSLSTKVRGRVLISALKDAAKPMRDEARNRTPAKTGITRKSITWRKEIRGGFTGIRLTGDFKLRFLEKGTKPRRRKKGGFTGSGPAYNIQSGAFDRKHQEVTDRFANSLGRKIDLALK